MKKLFIPNSLPVSQQLIKIQYYSKINAYFKLINKNVRLEHKKFKTDSPQVSLNSFFVKNQQLHYDNLFRKTPWIDDLDNLLNFFTRCGLAAKSRKKIYNYDFQFKIFRKKLIRSLRPLSMFDFWSTWYNPSYATPMIKKIKLKKSNNVPYLPRIISLYKQKKDSLKRFSYWIRITNSNNFYFKELIGIFSKINKVQLSSIRFNPLTLRKNAKFWKNKREYAILGKYDDRVDLDILKKTKNSIFYWFRQNEKSSTKWQWEELDYSYNYRSSLFSYKLAVKLKMLAPMSNIYKFYFWLEKRELFIQKQLNSFDKQNIKIIHKPFFGFDYISGPWKPKNLFKFKKKKKFIFQILKRKRLKKKYFKKFKLYSKNWKRKILKYQLWANLSRKLLFFPYFGGVKEWYILKKKHFSFGGVTRPVMAWIHRASNHSKIFGLRLNNNILLIKKFKYKYILQSCSKLNNIFLINWKKKCFSQFISHFNYLNISHYYLLRWKKKKRRYVKLKKKKIFVKYLPFYKKKKNLILKFGKLKIPYSQLVPYMWQLNYKIKNKKPLSKFTYFSYKFPYNAISKRNYKNSLNKMFYYGWLSSSNLYGGLVKINQLAFFNSDPEFVSPEGHHRGNYKIYCMSGNLSYIKFLRKIDWNIQKKWLKKRLAFRNITSQWSGKTRKNYRWRRKIRKTKNWRFGLRRKKKWFQRGRRRWSRPGKYIRSIKYLRRMARRRKHLKKLYGYHSKRYRNFKYNRVKYFKPTPLRARFRGMYKKRWKVFARWFYFKKYFLNYFHQAKPLAEYSDITFVSSSVNNKCPLTTFLPSSNKFINYNFVEYVNKNKIKTRRFAKKYNKIKKLMVKDMLVNSANKQKTSSNKKKNQKKKPKKKQRPVKKYSIQGQDRIRKNNISNQTDYGGGRSVEKWRGY